MDFHTFLETLKTGDVNQRFQLLSHLPEHLETVESAFQLIPVLTDLLDSDVFLQVEVTKQIGSISERFGVSEPLLETLEQLLQTEDSFVRKEAITVLVHLAGKENHGDAVVLRMCRKLGNADCFMQKMGLARLISSSFRFLSPEGQREAYHLFEVLTTDSSMAVRKTVTESLCELTENVSEEFKFLVLKLIIAISQDQEDMVRMLTVEPIASYVQRFPDDSLKAELVQIVKRFGNDNAWKVRHQLATHVSKIAASFGWEVSTQVLATLYAQLLQDQEAEVRNAACSNLAEFCAFLGTEKVAFEILPALRSLTTDVEFVKVTFAGQINKICPMVGEELTRQFLLDAMLDLLRDDSADIKMPLLKELESVKRVIGEESLAENIMPVVSELTRSRQWRVRLQLVELIPSFGQQLGREFFTAHFVEVFRMLIEDPVFTVRDTTLGILGAMRDLFGITWTHQYLLPLILNTKTRESYLHRLTALFGIMRIAEMLPKELVESELVPVVQIMSKDPVPNVRMNVAKASWLLQIYVSDTSPLISLLQTLGRDKDFDVRYWAECVR